MNDRPGMRANVWLYSAVAMGVVLFYPLSFGPAVWFASRDLLPQWAVVWLMWFYHPLNLVHLLPQSLNELFEWYVDLWR